MKRGLSSVITTVILVAIVIVAIGIVSVLIFGIIQNNAKKINSDSNNLLDNIYNYPYIVSSGNDNSDDFPSLILNSPEDNFYGSLVNIFEIKNALYKITKLNTTQLIEMSEVSNNLSKCNSPKIWADRVLKFCINTDFLLCDKDDHYTTYLFDSITIYLYGNRLIGYIMQNCNNTACSIYVICQNKDLPCPGKIAQPVRNGYAAMASQEQAMRNSAIDFDGTW
jgi:flagellin-like protein